ncbi:MAG TPA: GNAT family N-acetyltransferase [Candidatus Cybelea sp.]|nr:GNAT family N-acetyltransferase [Candidatus Cybelea sp.]
MPQRDGFFISTDPRRLDLDAIERLLRSSYWASERSRASTELAVKNSLCFGLYQTPNAGLIGLTRVVTDYSTFAWLCDVIIEEEYRGKGLGKWMMEVVLADPSVCHVRRWILATSDAHQLYERYGFARMAHSDRWMERVLRA